VSDSSPTGSVQVAEEVVLKKRARNSKKPKRQPRYNVILWDDQEHTPEYVVAMMQQLFGHPIEKGFQIAMEVDGRGRAIVLTTTKEHAELKRDQIHAYGKDPLLSTCKGSMSSSIEPLPE
jgi:ATP-dependent Clp protease adaptor protein ClpS